MKRLLIAALLAASLVLSLAAPAAAKPAIEIADSVTFTDVDPCTGLSHEVMIAMTFFVHDHDGITVARGVRTLSTSAGYVGGGTSSYVLNGMVEMFRFNDLLADGSGDRIRASGVFVLDLSSGAVRVDAFALTCLSS